eukprot:GHRQ01024077.1.p2 GENE.GHRQ01024077.1~~GHRQ01024077.1.p2  ORF type:complete len:199 (+),score=63.65 GHRQ01024077.1:1339-1935(+)
MFFRRTSKWLSAAAQCRLAWLEPLLLTRAAVACQQASSCVTHGGGGLRSSWSSFLPDVFGSLQQSLAGTPGNNPSNFSCKQRHAAYSSAHGVACLCLQDDVQHIRAAYDAFLAEYPLCYGYWKRYAEAEQRHGSSEAAAAVYERGVAATPYSTELWVAYAGLLLAADAETDAVRRCGTTCAGFVQGFVQPGRQGTCVF